VKFQERERSKGAGKGVGTTPSADEEMVGTVGIDGEIVSRLEGGGLDDVKWERRVVGRGRGISR